MHTLGLCFLWFCWLYLLYQVLVQLLLLLLDLPFPEDEQYVLYARTRGQFLRTIYFFGTRPHELWMAASHQASRFPAQVRSVVVRWPWSRVIKKLLPFLDLDLEP